MKALARFLYILSLAAFFVACGGGGGSAAPTTATPTATPPQMAPDPVSLNGYTVFQLNSLSSDLNAHANGINDMGQIVGWSRDSAGQGQHAVMWTVDQSGADIIQDLGTLSGGTFSFANGINNLGQVVGFADGSSGTRRPFIWTASGGIRDLGVPTGLVGGQAHRINDDGQIVGAVFATELSSFTEQARFAIWTVDQDGMVVDQQNLGDLGGIAATAWDNNAQGNVVGDIWFSGPQTGFFWSDAGGVVEIDSSEEALGINDFDEVAGIFLSGQTSEGFFWTAAAGITLIPDGPGLTINNSRQVTGVGVAGGSTYLWEDGDVILLPRHQGRDFSRAEAINELGWIVGWSTDVEGNEYANLWMPDQP